MRDKVFFALLCGATVFISPVAVAQQEAPQEYNIAAQDLGPAITQLAVASGRQIVVADDLVRGKRAKALRGRYSVEAALDALLSGSGLRATLVGNALVIRSSDEQDQDTPKDDITVTGTRIRGRGPVGSKVVTIDRKAIDDSGYATTQQIVEAIPQNFGGGANEANGSGTISGLSAGNASKGAGINLRGLGATSTLVLLNGDRAPLGGYAGSFFDVSLIPASIIERIEVLPDGASAIYGSDAVAGVVNIVPRLNFKGAESSARFGTADGDSQEYQLSQLFGFGWKGGHAVIAYEFYHRTNLAAADRSFATDDLRAFGGADRRSVYSSPGTIYAGGTTFAIPRGQDGRNLSAASLTPGTLNPGDSWYATDLLPDQRRHSVFVAAGQDLTDNVRLYARALFSARNYDQAIHTDYDTMRTVPVTNAFYVDPIGTHQPVRVAYSFVRDIGAERELGVAKNYGGTLGLDATFGQWKVDFHGNWGRNFETYALKNRVNAARLAIALADSNPATAYNLFGDGPSTNPDTIASIRSNTYSTYSGDQWSMALRADGPLFAMPAGDVRLAVGGEYREDRYNIGDSVSSTPNQPPVTTPGIPLLPVRRVKAGYAELLLPILGGGVTLPGFKRLDFSAAVRVEDYSDFGRTTNPRLGLEWQPVSALTLRGSFGTSFRAPTFQDLRQDPGSMAIFAASIIDPRSPTGVSNVIVIRGNDPNMKPERATTWTLGAELRPAGTGLHVALTYFNINYRDRIASIAPQLPNFLSNRAVYAPVISDNPSPARVAELFASPLYRDFFGITQTATFAAVLDGRTQNLSVVKESGLDFDLGYEFALARGKAEVGATASYIFNIDQQLTETANANNIISTVGNPVDLRIRGRAAWSNSKISATLYANYVDSYVNKTTGTTQKVSSWTTFDLQLAYHLNDERGPLKGLRFALSATNLFDRDPPFVAYYSGTYTTGYDPENASAMGRVISFQVTKKW